MKKKKQTLFLKMSGKHALKVIKGLKKLNDKERAVIGWKSVLFQSTKHRAEL